MGKNITAEDQHKIDNLAALGKEGKLWTLTVLFSVDTEAKRVIHRNLQSHEVMTLRKNMFIYGFVHPVSLGHWRIIMPLDITGIFLDKQQALFNG